MEGEEKRNAELKREIRRRECKRMWRRRRRKFAEDLE
jgi:hypothetical protein